MYAGFQLGSHTVIIHDILEVSAELAVHLEHGVGIDASVARHGPVPAIDQRPVQSGTRFDLLRKVRLFDFRGLLGERAAPSVMSAVKRHRDF